MKRLDLSHQARSTVGAMLSDIPCRHLAYTIAKKKNKHRQTRQSYEGIYIINSPPSFCFFPFLVFTTSPSTFQGMPREGPLDIPSVFNRRPQSPTRGRGTFWKSLTS